MGAEHLLILSVTIPLVGGAVALISKSMKSRALKITASSVAIASLGIAALPMGLAGAQVVAGQSVAAQLGGWADVVGISIGLDSLGLVTASVVLVLGFVIGLAAIPRYGDRPVFAVIYTVLCSGMLLASIVRDLFTMFVAFEIIAVCAYVLIAFDGKSGALVASFKYLILSSTGILFFLFGVFLIYREFGTLSLVRIGELAQTDSSRSIRLAVVALIVGVGVRTAVMPFHTWLPEAHSVAPHPVSAVLSGVLIKVSFVAIVRIVTVFQADQTRELLLWLGGITALGGALFALSQTNAKRLLAYHSVSQMGYIVAAYAAAGTMALPGAAAHLAGHALFKSLLFLTVGVAIDLSGSAKVTALGRRTRLPGLLVGLFMVGALSIAGVPPFNGFVSKAMVTAATKGTQITVLLWITGAITVASFTKLGRAMLQRPLVTTEVQGDTVPDIVTEGRPTDQASVALPVMAWISQVLLALLCVATGVIGGYGVRSLTTLLAGTAGDLALYSVQKLGSTLATLAAGITLYMVSRTRVGKTVSGAIESVRFSMNSVLVLFVLGLVIFAVVEL